jgi:hypothetical protein
VVDLERRTQPGDKLVVPAGQVRTFQLPLPLRGEGMQANAEQRLHLLRGHRISGVQTVDTSQPGADPHAGALTQLGVVAGERNVAFLGRIQGRDLPSQVVVPRPRRQLVDAHRHASQKPAKPR